MTARRFVPDPGDQTVLVRAFTARPAPPSTVATEPSRSRGSVKPSPFTVIFDIETSTDATQRPRFGTAQLRKGDGLVKSYMIEFPGGLNKTETDVARQVARRHNHVIIGVEKFVADVLVPFGQRNARIVAANASWDLSRLAVAHATARTRTRQAVDLTAGGFSFELLDNKPMIPRVRVKRLTDVAWSIEFTEADGRNPHARGGQRTVRRGIFCDVLTLGAVLYGKRLSLEGLCELLGTPTKKRGRGDHGQALTEDYVEYAIADTQATWECFCELKQRWRDTGLEGHTPLHKLHSEASIAKAALKAMNIRARTAEVADAA